MSVGLDRIVALKNSVLFLFLSKLLKIMYLKYFIKLYEYWGNFQSSYETKRSSVEKIMRLMIEEVLFRIDICRMNKCIHFCNFFSTVKKLAKLKIG